MSQPTQVILQAAHALRRSSHPALRKLSVESTEQGLVLTGQVTSYYLKQLAQETIMPHRGQLQLVNKVNVETEPVAVVVEAVRAGAQRQLVGRPPQVADQEPVSGEPPVEVRLDVAEVRVALGQGVADEDDAVAGLDLQAGCVVGRAGGGEQEQGREEQGAGGAHHRGASSGGPVRAGAGG